MFESKCKLCVLHSACPLFARNARLGVRFCTAYSRASKIAFSKIGERKEVESFEASNRRET